MTSLYSILGDVGCRFLKHTGLTDHVAYPWIDAEKVDVPDNLGLYRPLVSVGADGYRSTAIYLVSPSFTTVVTPRVLVHNKLVAEGRFAGEYFTDDAWYEYTSIILRQVIRNGKSMHRNRFEVIDIGKLIFNELKRYKLNAESVYLTIKGRDNNVN